MKKIIIISLLIMFMVSCEHSLMSYTIDATTYRLLRDVEYYDFADYDITDIDSIRDVSRFVRENVVYRVDIVEEFTSPEEILKRGYDDCDGMYFVFANLAYVTLGLKFDMVIVNTNQRTIVDGGVGSHIVARLDGVNYSATYGTVHDIQDVLYVFTFDEVFGGEY